MAPKKKKPETPSPVVDTRTPLEIDIDNTKAAIASLEGQLQRCKDGIAELAASAQKIRQLELDLQPKEADVKAVSVAFVKLVDGAVSARRLPSLANDAEQLEMAARAALGAPPDEAADRDAMRNVNQVVRSALTQILQAVFDSPLTAAEKRAQEGLPEPEPLPDPKVKKAIPPKDPTPAAPRDAFKVSEETFPCPAGFDAGIFNEMLRLRLQRLAAEAAARAAMQELEDAKVQIAKRKDEGATKSLQKRLERQMEDLNKTLQALEQQRAEATASGADQTQSSTAPTPPPTGKSNSKGKK
jgi:hypothetical protein